MNEIADQHCLRVRKLHTRRLTPPNGAVFNARVFDLLSEQHAVHCETLEQQAPAVEQPHRMTAMLVDRHVADFNVCRAVRPFAYMKDSH
jgi:hypothetical protein